MACAYTVRVQKRSPNFENFFSPFHLLFFASQFGDDEFLCSLFKAILTFAKSVATYLEGGGCRLSLVYFKLRLSFIPTEEISLIILHATRA